MAKNKDIGLNDTINNIPMDDDKTRKLYGQALFDCLKELIEENEDIKLDDIDVASTVDDIGITILPTSHRDEDDDTYPTYSKSEIIDLLSKEGTNVRK